MKTKEQLELKTELIEIRELLERTFTNVPSDEKELLKAYTVAIERLSKTDLEIRIAYNRLDELIETL